MEKHEFKLREVLAKTKNRKPDPLAHDDQLWLYQIFSPMDGFLYVGLSGSPLKRIRQHYARPWESKIGHLMRNDAAFWCLDNYTCFVYSASGGFAEERSMIEKLRPSLNTYDKPKEPVQSDVTNDEPPSDF